MAEENRLKLTAKDFAEMFSDKTRQPENTEEYYAQFGHSDIQNLVRNSKDMTMEEFWEQAGKALRGLFISHPNLALKYLGMAAEHRAKEAVLKASIEAIMKPERYGS